MNPYEKLHVHPFHSKKEVDEAYKHLLETHTSDVSDETTEELTVAYSLLVTSFQQVERIKKYKDEAEDLLAKGAIPKPTRKSSKRFSKPKIKLEDGINHADFMYPTVESSISKYRTDMKSLPIKRIYLLLAWLLVLAAPFINAWVYEMFIGY